MKTRIRIVFPILGNINGDIFYEKITNGRIKYDNIVTSCDQLSSIFPKTAFTKTVECSVHTCNNG